MTKVRIVTCDSLSSSTKALYISTHSWLMRIFDFSSAANCKIFCFPYQWFPNLIMCSSLQGVFTLVNIGFGTSWTCQNVKLKDMNLKKKHYKHFWVTFIPNISYGRIKRGKVFLIFVHFSINKLLLHFTSCHFNNIFSYHKLLRGSMDKFHHQLTIFTSCYGLI